MDDPLIDHERFIADMRHAFAEIGAALALGLPEITEALLSPFDPTCECRSVAEIGEIARARQRELRESGGRR